MLKTISSTDSFVQVQNGNTLATYISTSSSLGVGNLRYNNATQCIEVFDGYSWIMLNMNYVTINLSQPAHSAIEWAINKKQEEELLEKKARDNKTLADLLEQKKKVEEQIKIVDILTKDDKVGTN